MMSSLVSNNDDRSTGATTYQIVGHFTLPAGYTITTGAMPTYITGANTIYVFATKGANNFLLALSGSTGALKATPIKFSGGLSSHFVYDTLNSWLFIGGSRIVAISTSTNKVVANFTARDGSASIAYDSYNNQVYSSSCPSGYCGSGISLIDVFNAATGVMKARIQVAPAGTKYFTSGSIIYDGNNHNIYVDYYGYNSAEVFVDQVAVIKGNSLSVSVRMDAPDIANSEFDGYGGYLVFDPTTNVLFDKPLDEAIIIVSQKESDASGFRVPRVLHTARLSKFDFASTGQAAGGIYERKVESGSCFDGNFVGNDVHDSPIRSTLVRSTLFVLAVKRERRCRRTRPSWCWGRRCTTGMWDPDQSWCWCTD